MRLALLALASFFVPAIASAHEVYVLSKTEIANALITPPFDMLAVVRSDLGNFAFWGFIAVLVVFGVFFISISRTLEKRFDPVLTRGRKYAPLIARVTVGISFIAAAYYQASYGPELPLLPAFGMYTPLITAVLVVIGLLIIFGIYARVAALVALLLFTYAVYRNGMYMLTYTNYLGEILVLLILGSHENLKNKLAPYSFLLLRVCFGISLFYASIYAKILHNNLALDVASMPLGGHMVTIAAALGFEPHFLVLGAAIIEIVVALFFILGLEIRFTSIFLLFWLSLSLWWFGEVVWPHIILIGIPIAFILYGYDQYSLEGRFFKKGKREPVL